jgi:hypothetical protein
MGPITRDRLMAAWWNLSPALLHPPLTSSHDPLIPEKNDVPKKLDPFGILEVKNI